MADVKEDGLPGANNRRRRVRARKCPECSSAGVVPILYGMPTREAWEAAERGEFVLGGCTVDEGQPTWSCSACGHQWDGDGARRR